MGETYLHSLPRDVFLLTSSVLFLYPRCPRNRWKKDNLSFGVCACSFQKRSLRDLCLGIFFSPICLGSAYSQVWKILGLANVEALIGHVFPDCQVWNGHWCAYRCLQNFVSQTPYPTCHGHWYVLYVFLVGDVVVMVHVLVQN